MHVRLFQRMGQGSIKDLAAVHDLFAQTRWKTHLYCAEWSLPNMHNSTELDMYMLAAEVAGK